MKNQDRQITSFSDSYKIVAHEMWTNSTNNLGSLREPSKSTHDPHENSTRTARPAPKGPLGGPSCFLSPHPHPIHYSRASHHHPHPHCWHSGIILCPVHSKMFRSILGLYPLDASNTTTTMFPPVVTAKNISSHCQMFPWGKNHARFRTTAHTYRGICKVLHLSS